MRSGQIIYPFEPWTVTESSFDTETNQRDETVFAVGNGYIGIRGNFEEGYDGPPGTSLHGTYLNGFYDSSPIAYPKARHYGHPRVHQTMLNVTDGKLVELYVDGEKFNLFSERIGEYSRRLDMRKGTVIRTQVWETATGKKLRIRIERFASFARKHLAAIRYEVTPLNFSGRSCSRRRSMGEWRIRLGEATRERVPPSTGKCCKRRKRMSIGRSALCSN